MTLTRRGKIHEKQLVFITIYPLVNFGPLMWKRNNPSCNCLLAKKYFESVFVKWPPPRINMSHFFLLCSKWCLVFHFQEWDYGRFFGWRKNTVCLNIKFPTNFGCWRYKWSNKRSFFVCSLFSTTPSST